MWEDGGRQGWRIVGKDSVDRSCVIKLGMMRDTRLVDSW